MPHITDNPFFKAFREKLAAEGVKLAFTWDAKSPVPNHRLYYIVFHAPAGSVPAIVIDYGQDGFGLYPEEQSNRLDDFVLSVTAPLDRKFIEEQARTVHAVLNRWEQDDAKVPMNAIVAQTAINLTEHVTGKGLVEEAA